MHVLLSARCWTLLCISMQASKADADDEAVQPASDLASGGSRYNLAELMYEVTHLKPMDRHGLSLCVCEPAHAWRATGLRSLHFACVAITPPFHHLQRLLML